MDVISFWIIWFLITILISKVWPEIGDSERNRLGISWATGILGFIVTALIFLVFKTSVF